MSGDALARARAAPLSKLLTRQLYEAVVRGSCTRELYEAGRQAGWQTITESQEESKGRTWPRMEKITNLHRRGVPISKESTGLSVGVEKQALV